MKHPDHKSGASAAGGADLAAAASDPSAILAYNQWSFAGKDSAQSVNLMNAQPIYVKHERWGYWGWTDQAISVDWKNNLTSFPLGVRFGNVIHWSKMPIKVELGAYYTLNNKGRDNTCGVKFQFSPIFPNGL